MLKTLRPYQAQALQKLRQRLKEVTHPLLVNASVGAGKSLILSELLLDMERANYKALCLTMNSTLIRQNAETYQLQGGTPGIFCAALNRKDIHQNVIFASPHSWVKTLPDIKINLIIIDECHAIEHTNPDTMYMRIINHYGHKAQENNYSFRMVGLTGTPFRGKGISICGPNELFKEEVCSITTSWLINKGYLVPIQFNPTITESFDYSKLTINNLGKFNANELQSVIDKNERLTAKIMREVRVIVENGRNGAIIFAATRRHCEECAKALPEGSWAIITGETSHKDRENFLQMAKLGAIKYLINVNCLLTGVDVPCLDVCAWLRPTESLVLYTQGIGRILRLHPSKKDGIVLDYAGNIDRHGHIDDPIINQAVQQLSQENPDYCIPCYDCGTLNKVTTRRCIGTHNNKRCDHYFEFKECLKCQTPNDIVCRHCRQCEAELIDPNTKLKLKNEVFTLNVLEANYWVSVIGYTSFPVINVKYKTDTGDVFESFATSTEKSKNITYAKFVRHHVPKASDYYIHLTNINRVKEMIHNHDLYTPLQLICTKDEYGRFKVIKKVFQMP